MNVLLASSEIVPFAKTGGLADVCGALPGELKQLGVNVAAIMPAYRSVRSAGTPIRDTGIEFDIPIGEKIMPGRLLRTEFPGVAARGPKGQAIPLYLVDQDYYFNRPELYRENQGDYQDNCERFIFYCRAVMESIRLLDQTVDLIHCNDWQTGLIPAYLKTEYAHTPGYEHIASLFTIHNMAYQGRFWHWDMPLTGLDWQYFNWRQMEFYGDLNLLKTGLVFADAINTVSQRYAEEIQTPEQGCGLEGVLQSRRDVLTGILNGVDESVWNPQTDRYLAANYDVSCWTTGKPRCKRDLQERCGLPRSAKTPLVGMIGRLAEQKGWDLILEVMERWAPTKEVQWVILGTGEPRYERALAAMAGRWPGKMAVRLAYSDEWAHKIEAGSDIFLMASRYEPCGLNQMYSLKYGAVPIVHKTGGLADTIQSVTEEATSQQTKPANGFSFAPFSVDALEKTLARACWMLQSQGDQWRRLVESGMKQDWSWSSSARKYVDLYQRTCANVRRTAH